MTDQQPHHVLREYDDFELRHYPTALLAAVRRAGLEPVGGVYFARFDPPWKPGFLKHNEALVAVA